MTPCIDGLDCQMARQGVLPCPEFGRRAGCSIRVTMNNPNLWRHVCALAVSGNERAEEIVRRVERAA